MIARPTWTLATMISTGLLLGPTLLPPPPRLLWNATASMPVGLYAVRPVRRLQRGEIVAVRPPERLARYLDHREFLPYGLPLLKPVAALGGDTVCRRDRVLSLNGRPQAVALDRDHLGRPLPVWQGCRRLGAQDVFLLIPSQKTSLDGRYFGVLPTSAIVGKATPLWLPKTR